MVEIQFYNDGKIIKGILLGRYRRLHSEMYLEKKRFLWMTKQTYKQRQYERTLYIIFIPWRHRMKEIVEIDEKDILEPKSIQWDQSWIKVDKYISRSSDSWVNEYREGIEITDYIGYRFIYDYNHFLISIILHEWQDSLTVLYENLPEILEIDLCNQE